MQRPLDAGAVILAESADADDHVLEVFGGNRPGAQLDDALGEAGFRHATQVHDDLEEVLKMLFPLDQLAQGERKHVDQLVEIVGDFGAAAP